LLKNNTGQAFVLLVFTVVITFLRFPSLLQGHTVQHPQFIDEETEPQGTEAKCLISEQIFLCSSESKPQLTNPMVGKLPGRVSGWQ
jgi:hypothetical protein